MGLPHDRPAVARGRQRPGLWRAGRLGPRRLAGGRRATGAQRCHSGGVRRSGTHLWAPWRQFG
eukprot:6236869-Lingulodinium_polyedra.AAC.1